MRYVDGNYNASQTTKALLFGKSGNVLDSGEVHKLPHYAKTLENTSSGNFTYFIRIYQSVPFDPMGPYGKRERTLDTQMKRVSKNTFDFYMTYLKTNNSIYLTKAQRGFLND